MTTMTPQRYEWRRFASLVDDMPEIFQATDGSHFIESSAHDGRHYRTSVVQTDGRLIFECSCPSAYYRPDRTKYPVPCRHSARLMVALFLEVE